MLCVTSVIHRLGNDTARVSGFSAGNSAQCTVYAFQIEKNWTDYMEYSYQRSSICVRQN